MIVVSEDRAAAVPAHIGRDPVVRYDPRDPDWPHGTVLLMSACLAAITLAAERGDRLRVTPSSIEGVFDEVSQALGRILLPPEAREARRRGRRAMDAGDLVVAEASFDEACRLGLNDEETKLWRGWARLGLGRFDEAAADLGAVLGRDPLEPPAGEWRPIAAYLRAVLREAQGDLAGALERLRAGRGARPDRRRRPRPARRPGGARRLVDDARRRITILSTPQIIAVSRAGTRREENGMARSRKAARPLSRRKTAARPGRRPGRRPPRRPHASRPGLRGTQGVAPEARPGRARRLRIADPAPDRQPGRRRGGVLRQGLRRQPGLMMDGPGGVIMHGELKIGDSILMLADEQPPMGPGPARKTPEEPGGTSSGVMLYVKDVDAVYARAVAAGATGVMPPIDMFWGDRYCQVEDPFGHVWAIATHVKDMTARQMKQAAMTAMPPPPQA